MRTRYRHGIYCCNITFLWLLLLLCCYCCWRWWLCFVLVLLYIYCCRCSRCSCCAALYCWSATCEILCPMRLWYEKGSLLLRTGNTIWKVKAKKYLPAADAGDGALYWCCSIFTAAAAPSAPAAALRCWSATEIILFLPVDFVSDEIVIQKGSLLLCTGKTIWKVNAKNIYRVRINLSWKVKVII